MPSWRFHISTPGRGLVDITGKAREAVRAHTEAAGEVDGLCHVFIHHTSASLIITENASPDVWRDLDVYFSRIVPDGDPMFRHTEEGPDDMSAHVRCVLTASQVSVPIHDGKLDLGTWQGLYLFEHRTRPHTRKVTVTVVSC